MKAHTTVCCVYEECSLEADALRTGDLLKSDIIVLR